MFKNITLFRQFFKVYQFIDNQLLESKNITVLSRYYHSFITLRQTQ